VPHPAYRPDVAPSDFFEFMIRQFEFAGPVIVLFRSIQASLQLFRYDALLIGCVLWQ
jgi:hypothetical protein